MKEQLWEFINFTDYLDKAVYSKNREIFITVPKDEDSSDYNDRVKQIIEKLSIVHKIKKGLIYQHIEYMNYDILKLKLRSGKSKDNTLLLKDYPEIIENLRKIIKFSLCSEWEFKKSYTKPFHKVDLVADRCKVGQTEKGSYVFNIFVPILEKISTIKKLNSNEKEKLKYLGRNSIIRLINGLKEAKDINIENKTKFESNFERLEYKLSKNVFDNVSNLMMREDGYDLEFSANFDITDKNYIPDDYKEIKIESSNCYKTFLKCSKYLEKEKEIKISKISGLITQVKKDFEENKLRIIIDDDRNNKNIHITIDFNNKKHYNLVFKAFKMNNKIASEGDLWKSDEKNKWIFDNMLKLEMEMKMVDFFKNKE